VDRQAGAVLRGVYAHADTFDVVPLFLSTVTGRGVYCSVSARSVDFRLCARQRLCCRAVKGLDVRQADARAGARRDTSGGP
jgi:hypothetical protein